MCQNKDSEIRQLHANMLSKNLIRFDNATGETLSQQVQIEAPNAAGLRLRYRLNGDISQLRIPAPLPPAAADDLWKHSCFELFVTTANAAAYHEFNFSFSAQWAAYAFSDYPMRQPWT